MRLSNPDLLRLLDAVYTNSLTLFKSHPEFIELNSQLGSALGTDNKELAFKLTNQISASLSQYVTLVIIPAPISAPIAGQPAQVMCQFM